jgi:hypothetical protein
VTETDFPEGGVLIHQETHPWLGDKTSEMIMLYPNVKPIEDTPTVSLHQLDEVITKEKNSSDGLVLVITDEALEDVKQELIKHDLRYARQYKLVDAGSVINGESTIDDIDDEKEVVYIQNYEAAKESDQVDELNCFIKQVHDKVTRTGRRAGVLPTVIVFSKQLPNIADEWITPNSKVIGVKGKERDVAVTRYK